MTISESYHAGGDSDDWLGDTASVCYRILELVEQIVELDEDVTLRRRRDLAAGYPTRSSGAATSGGPTARTHDFTTGEDVKPGAYIPGHDLASIPQHTDPTGEAAVRDSTVDDLGKAGHAAFTAMCAALHATERAKSALARTRPGPSLVENERDRDICWPCADAGISNPIRIDGKLVPGAVASTPPRCRNHARYFRSDGFLDKAGHAAEVWLRRGDVSPTLLQRWIDEERAATKERAKRKRGKGRR